MRIGNVELESPLRLAPMADITNIAFRLVARECGSAMVTSEEIDAYSLLMGSERSWRTAAFLEEERPIALQMLGADPKILAEAAKRLEATGPDMIDLNMGCPMPKITCRGQGAALMRDPLKAAQILRAIRRAIRIPFTIKIRSGWDQEHLNAVEIARIAEAEGVDAITVHPRTRSQRFTGKASWEIIADVVAAVKIPVTGNGDVKSYGDAQRMMKETGAVSVMIGRGALGKPWIFNCRFETLAPKERRQYQWRVICRHRELIERYTFEKTREFQLKKHLVWYSAGLPHSAKLRNLIFTSPDAATAWKIFQEHWHRSENYIVGNDQFMKNFRCAVSPEELASSPPINA